MLDERRIDRRRHGLDAKDVRSARPLLSHRPHIAGHGRSAGESARAVSHRGARPQRGEVSFGHSFSHGGARPQRGEVSFARFLSTHIRAGRRAIGVPPRIGARGLASSVPMPDQHGSFVRAAADLARQAHAGQVRKAGGIPYFAHLDAVVAILVEHGCADDTTLAAAYLHDVIEDCAPYESRLRSEMPLDVIETVEVLTEVKLDAAGHKRHKRARFEGYLAALGSGTPAARRAIPVSCADKIDNTRSLVAAERSGHQLLRKLTTKPGEHAGQLAALRAIYAGVVPPALLATFDAAARALLETIEAWLPGRAVSIAADAHLGQFDKAGAPYVYHPLRLMMRAQTREEKMTAVLHDVVEDTDWTLEALTREGFPRSVVRALDHLTRRDEETYDAFIERIARNRLAARVKLLDLADNSDLSRIAAPTDEDRARLEKYRRASARLEAELEKRSLQVVLDEESAAQVRAMAIHREVRGDHVTLAHRVDPAAFDAAWIPGGAKIGDRLSITVRGQSADERVQALAVDIAGSGVRPYDDGTLHVTVSLVPEARASESNDLFVTATLSPLRMQLAGTVQWVED
jgi:hypothetical protein